MTAALRALPGLRDAEPGEFTRRAFENGRVDLAQAEALGDLLAAETELQRLSAQSGVGGMLSREVEQWRGEVLALAAAVEAQLDFADEVDEVHVGESLFARRAALAEAIAGRLAAPRAERLREGVRVVLSGPPNVGKSSLFNALIGESAAIVAASPGTTRDTIERPVALGGVPFILVDTAGLRAAGAGAIEREGIARAQAQVQRADIVLWLGPEGAGPSGALEIQARSDDPRAPVKVQPAHVVSSVTGEGLAALVDDLVARATANLPKPGMAAINARQATLLEEACEALRECPDDLLLLAETLRRARVAFDRFLGRAGIEDMLDTLFGRFCIGK